MGDLVAIGKTYGASALAGAESLSMDLLIAIVLLAILFAYGTWRGKDSLITLILSFYISALLASALPYSEALARTIASDVYRAAAYGIGFIVIAYIISLLIERIFYAESFVKGFRGHLDTLLLSIASSALLISFAVHVIPLESLYTFGSSTFGAWIVREDVFFYVLLIPIALLALLGLRK